MALPHSTKWVAPKTSHQDNGICWYRKHFTLPNTYLGRKAFVQFLGAMQQADVWLNGVYLGKHLGGFMEFTYDVTSSAKFNGTDNLLAVRLDNRSGSTWTPGNTNPDISLLGGLYRDVNFYVTDNLHVTDAVFATKVAGGGIFVTYPTVTTTSATVSIKTDVVNQNMVSKVYLRQKLQQSVLHHKFPAYP